MPYSFTKIMTVQYLQIDARDNVAVALQTLHPNKDHQNGLPRIREPIPAKHKFSLVDIPKGAAIFMYGSTVGVASENLTAGTLLTTENTEHEIEPFGVSRRQFSADWQSPDVSSLSHRTFLGYPRTNGQYGTANYWLVIPLVFCENRNVLALKDAFEDAFGVSQGNPYSKLFKDMISLHKRGAPMEEILALKLPKEEKQRHSPFKNVDGVKFLIHGQGCGGTRQDSDALCGLLAGYITHPNVGGVTVLSLGCQNAEVKTLESEIAKRDPNFNKPYEIFEQQRYGSEKNMLAAATRQIFSGLDQISKIARGPAPLSALTIGLECGGSDGFSGISANPLLGLVSDKLTALDGRVILAEFPELCGVEQSIINRCINTASAEKFEHLMKLYSRRAQEAGSGFDMNPSPGNIRDGLITDAMKSAGAARKGGSSPIVDVLDYPEWITQNGLNLLCTPGGDVESTTAMTGAGANLILFTTGLGTPTGNVIAPTIKVSSNTKLAQSMPDIIDFDAGPIIKGNQTIEEMGNQLIGLIVEVASGHRDTRATRLGQDDFLPWKRGISL